MRRFLRIFFVVYTFHFHSAWARSLADTNNSRDSTVTEPTLNHNGFIKEDLILARKLAQTQNKLLFIDFGAPWCPACVRLDSEVFGTEEFKNGTKKFIKVAINVDLVNNHELMEHYGVKSFPTIIIATDDGVEVYRILDYSPTTALVRELKSNVRHHLVSVIELEKKAKNGDIKSIQRLAHRASLMGDSLAGAKWFALIPEKSLEKSQVLTDFWSEKDLKDPVNKANYEKALREALEIFPSSLNAIFWRLDLAKSDKENKAVLAANILAIRKLLDSPKDLEKAFQDSRSTLGEFTFEKALLQSKLIETYETARDEPNIKTTKLELGKEMSKVTLTLDKPGVVLSSLAYFREAGMGVLAEEWLLKLAKAYPDDYAYPMKLTSWYLKTKDYAKGLPYAEKTVALFPGSLYNFKQLATIQTQLKQTAEAKKTIEKALALPEAQFEKNKQTIQELKALEKTLE